MFGSWLTGKVGAKLIGTALGRMAVEVMFLEDHSIPKVEPVELKIATGFTEYRYQRRPGSTTESDDPRTNDSDFPQLEPGPSC